MATKFIPIWIKETALTVRSIDSAEEGIAFLNNYRGDHGAVFHMTRWTLQKAVDGEADAEHARAAFYHFAEDLGMLSENAAA